MSVRDWKELFMYGRRRTRERAQEKADHEAIVREADEKYAEDARRVRESVDRTRELLAARHPNQVTPAASGAN
jgi:hypothetical protein